MSPEERRVAIVRATLPLLSQHGAQITTRQIAQAAGVAEGTVFRAFPDKEELLRACVAEAFRPDKIRVGIERISPDKDLEARLEEAALLFAEHFEHIGQLMESLATSGYDIHRHQPKDHKAPEEFMRNLVEVLATLVAPDTARCRIAVDDLSRMLIGLVMTMRFDPEARRDKHTAVRQRIDILLHGALKNS